MSKFVCKKNFAKRLSIKKDRRKNIKRYQLTVDVCKMARPMKCRGFLIDLTSSQVNQSLLSRSKFRTLITKVKYRLSKLKCKYSLCDLFYVFMF